MTRLKFDLRPAIRAAKKKNAKLILIQAPEGLKTRIAGIAKEIGEKTGAKTVISVKPCYGACDIPLNEIKLMGADLVIHFGHTKMIEGKNIEYVPLNYSAGEKTLARITKKLVVRLKKNEWKKIGIVSTAQYLAHLEIVKKQLEELGFKVFVGKSSFMKHGQILGCNTEAAEQISEKVDCFVFVGDGRFHPLGAAASTGKPLFTLSPMTGKIGEIEEKEIDRIERAHQARIGIARGAKSFGILVSTKLGQFNLKKALALKDLAERNGREASVLSMDAIQEDFVIGMGFECFVNTACLRIVLDDSSNWSSLLVSAEEMELALE